MKRRAWIVLLALLLIPVVPGLADARNGHGRGHGYKGGHGHRGGYGHNRGHVRRGGHSYRGWYGYKRGFRSRAWWYAPWWYPVYAVGYRYASPYAYPYAYPYQPGSAVIAGETPVYVERPASAAPAPPQQAYWHYCESLGGYYPDVARCPEGWVKVPPRPE